MKCPSCGSRQLNVAVAFTGNVSCAFRGRDEFEIVDEVALDSHWDDRSPCSCVRCSWSGEVSEARGRLKTSKPAPVAVRKAGISPRDLEALKERVRSGECPPRWVIQINRLIAEVERLAELAEMLASVSPDKHAPSSGDTQIW
jgi:hypothetical protein